MGVDYTIKHYIMTGGSFVASEKAVMIKESTVTVNHIFPRKELVWNWLISNAVLISFPTLCC